MTLLGFTMWGMEGREILGLGAAALISINAGMWVSMKKARAKAWSQLKTVGTWLRMPLVPVLVTYNLLPLSGPYAARHRVRGVLS